MLAVSLLALIAGCASKPKQVMLTMAVAGNGSVTSTPAGIACPTTCSAAFPSGTLVTLLAAAGSGSSFAGWSGDCAGTGACVLLADRMNSVSATFAVVASYPVAVSKAGNGSGSVVSTPAGINCGGACNGTFAAGTLVLLSAAPGAHSTFAGWSGDCTGMGPCLLGVAAAKSATATFTTILVTVTLAGTGSGSIKSTPSGIDCPTACAASFLPGTAVVLAASAAAGSAFTGWSGECSGTGTCAVNGNQAVGATFVPYATGSMVNRYFTDSGAVLSPVDLTAGVVQLQAWLADANLTPAPVTVNADGTYALPTVPIGTEYYLSMGNVPLGGGPPFIIDTSAPILDLGTDLLGRPTVAIASTDPTTLVFDGTGLSPWQPHDYLEVFSINAGLVFPINFVLPFDDDSYSGGPTDPGALNFPSPGATSLASASLDYFQDCMDQGCSSTGPVPLVDARAGDSTSVTQLATQSAGGFEYQALASKFELSGVTMADGATTTLSGVFAPVSQDATLTLNWRLSQFYAAMIAAQPATSHQQQALNLEAAVGGVQGPDLIESTPAVSAADTGPVTLSYGDPFPAEWTRWLYVADSYAVCGYSIGGATEKCLGHGQWQIADLATFPGGDIVPIIGPPSAPMVNGQDASVPSGGAVPVVTGVGLTPTISWTAPSIGTPSLFGINIVQLFVHNGATKSRPVAFLRMASTGVRVPPGIFQAGQSYVLGIRAVTRHPLTDIGRSFNSSGGAASILTAILQP